MMAEFAKNTTVPVKKSRDEIETTLERYGADQFMYARDGDEWMVAFRAQNRHIRFTVSMPKRSEYDTTSQGYTRAKGATDKAVAQAERQRWRALLLVIKAKLEAIQAGISTFDEEFMAHIVLPDGSRLAELIIPQIEESYETASMPPLLAGPRE